MKGFGNAWNLWRYFTCTYNMEIGFMIFNKFKSSGDTKSWSLHLFKQFDTMCFVKPSPRHAEENHQRQSHQQVCHASGFPGTLLGAKRTKNRNDTLKPEDEIFCTSRQFHFAMCIHKTETHSCQQELISLRLIGSQSSRRFVFLWPTVKTPIDALNNGAPLGQKNWPFPGHEKTSKMWGQEMPRRYPSTNKWVRLPWYHCHTFH